MDVPEFRIFEFSNKLNYESLKTEKFESKFLAFEAFSLALAKTMLE